MWGRERHTHTRTVEHLGFCILEIVPYLHTQSCLVLFYNCIVFNCYGHAIINLTSPHRWMFKLLQKVRNIGTRNILACRSFFWSMWVYLKARVLDFLSQIIKQCKFHRYHTSENSPPAMYETVSPPLANIQCYQNQNVLSLPARKVKIAILI